jgi:hypothetical protein
LIDTGQEQLDDVELRQLTDQDITAGRAAIKSTAPFLLFGTSRRALDKADRLLRASLQRPATTSAARETAASIMARTETSTEPEIGTPAGPLDVGPTEPLPVSPGLRAVAALLLLVIVGVALVGVAAAAGFRAWWLVFVPLATGLTLEAVFLYRFARVQHRFFLSHVASRRNDQLMEAIKEQRSSSHGSSGD